MHNKINILIVSSGNIRGVVPFIKEQADSLSKNSINISFFTITDKGIIGYLKNVKRLKEVLKKQNIQLIHAHFGFCGLFSNLQRKVPVITTFHGSDVNKWSMRPFSKIAYFLSKWSVAVSGKLVKRLGVKQKISIIPCGIDSDCFYPINKVEARKAMGLDISKNYILFTSRFTNKVKNSELAIVSVRKFKNTELIELWDYSRKEVNLLINACDLLLMTSFTEGSPQVIKEAMACNCPIISVDVGEVKEIISDTRGCFIVDYSVKEIEEKISSIYEGFKTTLGREKIDKFDNDKISLKIIKLYKEVLNENSISNK